MGEPAGSYCEVVDVLARRSRVPGMLSFFRALKDSPTPFDATVEEQHGHTWDRIEFLLRGRRGVVLEAIRSRTPGFRDRIRELMTRAEQGRPRKARPRVLEHLGRTRVVYRLKVREWVESDDDWLFIFMLGIFLCERGQALLHNPTEGFVLPGEGRLLRP